MFILALVCVDTAGWIHGWNGNNCEEFRTRNCNGMEEPIGMEEWREYPEEYNYPQYNCCGCGKEHHGKFNLPTILV